MKKILYILFLLPVFCRGQNIKLPIDSDTKKITYQEVVHVDSTSKDELYTRAREWFARNFVSSKEVLQMEDRAAGKIIGKGSADGYATFQKASVGYWLHYTISITIKEGRYRYEITDFKIQMNPSVFIHNPQSYDAEYYYNFTFQDTAISKNLVEDIKKEYQQFYQKINQTGTSLSLSLKETLSRKYLLMKTKDNF